MGTQKVSSQAETEALRAFTARLVRDLDRLERLLDEGAIETGPTRIGAELEMVLTDPEFRPTRNGPQILEEIEDSRITPELGAFNLEMNTLPRELGGSCLSDMESELIELLGVVREAAGGHDTRVVLAGILPTLEPGHASLDFMTPKERYRQLNEAMTALRGGTYRVFIKGVDEIDMEHHNVMLEACNTSFQVHLQVDPARFARTYNIGLLATAPLLAVAANSPLLFGRRLWRETRIALFQQSIDTRRPAQHRFLASRVDFGTSWVDDSVLEIYRDDVARFRAIITADPEEDPPGQAPRLAALQLFNSTVYRWLRPCYGVADGTAHLRIENRILPAGPTPRDQMANAAFWYGLIYGLEDAVGDPRETMSFDDVRGNFISAARLGLSAPIDWIDGRGIGARDLILEELLPIAAAGLERAGVDSGDADRYLGIIRERAESRQTGSEWVLRALDTLEDYDAAPWSRLTEAIHDRQMENTPVHEWTTPQVPHRSIADRLRREIGAHMQRDLVTAQETDPASLAIRLMRWKRIRHLPIEDADYRLVGIITRSTLFRFLAEHEGADSTALPLSEIMHSDLVTAPPSLSVADAIRLMRERGVSSLPVVEEGKLVGLVTERDFLGLAADALFREDQRDTGPGRPERDGTDSAREPGSG